MIPSAFKRVFLPLLLTISLLTSCAAVREDVSPEGGEAGIASWYGKDFHGRPTASGEAYDMYAMTAAHKTLPLGTIVNVKNLENGRDVRVVVNDRGPFVRGRIIDLSYSAAKELDMVGS
ncbi:MAG: septal ring lytic transglycosylase RlpA family protein, partial [Deltaproteobacteria bacterium]|nr:septal ring lytic transglycosylase RlpA family protein [Deltaproteobacteria bacterium]